MQHRYLTAALIVGLSLAGCTAPDNADQPTDQKVPAKLGGGS